MSTSFEMRPDRFVTGTIGPPGQRVFYLQASQGAEVVTLRLEKQQVAALAEYLAGIMSDLPPTEAERQPTELIEPVDEAWTIGSLGVAYDEAADRVLLVAEELVPDDEESAEPGIDPASARFHLRRGQVVAFIDHAVEVVLSGRPPCPVCGRPMNPDGHQCPRRNGHRPD
jgi:uncharacterized repeat protein (TIGR03847 family)